MQLLNTIKGLNKEEYKKAYQAADKIELNMVLKELKPSAVSLLEKIT